MMMYEVFKFCVKSGVNISLACWDQESLRRDGFGLKIFDPDHVMFWLPGSGRVGSENLPHKRHFFNFYPIMSPSLLQIKSYAL